MMKWYLVIVLLTLISACKNEPAVTDMQNEKNTTCESSNATEPSDDCNTVREELTKEQRAKLRSEDEPQYDDQYAREKELGRAPKTDD